MSPNILRYGNYGIICTTQTNEMHKFIYYYLISYICYMFRTLWVHPHGDSFICSLFMTPPHF